MAIRGSSASGDGSGHAAGGLIARFSGRAATNSAHSGSRAEKLLESYEASGQGWFWATDRDGNLAYISSAIAAKLGRDTTELLGAPLASLFEDGKEVGGRSRTLSFILNKKTKFETMVLKSAAVDADIWWSLSGQPQLDAQGDFDGFMGHGADVTDQQLANDQTDRLTRYDVLTGLVNRFQMTQLLEKTLSAFQVQDRSCAIMLLDLDRFKQVNDTMGHPAGDALLQQVAGRLTKVIGDREQVCRLGGDEFQIILPDIDDRGKLGDIAGDIIERLSQPYSVNGSRCIIGASVGIAVSPWDGKTSEELVRNADLALYAAKDSGRGRFRFFSSDLLDQAADRRAIEDDLVDALTNGELQAHYQPVVATATNRVEGFEALMRWEHPERGWVAPSVFIPIAEESDLIRKLGEWILRQACMDAAKWPSHVRVAVNISTHQFLDPSLPKQVVSALANAGLRADRLELEITESVFLEANRDTDKIFKSLKDIGVRLALDDFGTGYSSLAYLKTAPFDKIKIDQNFVEGLTEPGSRNPAIVTAIVALAKSLDMETTAEGIETMDQLSMIQQLGVSHIQGWAYGKAIPFDESAGGFTGGDWIITPSGPAKQRPKRHSMFRRAGAVHENHYYPMVIKNLSMSGALIEGILDVPVGTQFVIDFGEGQLSVATVRRSRKNQQGVEFEEPLVDDGNGGLCTRHRVPSYLLKASGIPSGPISERGEEMQSLDISKAGLPAFRTDNGLQTPLMTRGQTSN